METTFSYTDADNGMAWFSTDRRKIINRILKLLPTCGDQITILAYPQDNDGCLYGKLPADWIKISPPRQLSEAERERLAERGRAFGFKQAVDAAKTTPISASMGEDE